MKATITDTEALQSLGPAEVALYLRSHEWKLSREIGNKGAVWRKNQGMLHAPELLLPLRHDLDDYAERMAEVLQTLETDEGRSQLDVLHEITDSTADIVRIRLQGPVFEDGSVPIDQAAQVVDQAREMMLAAACSTVQPRLVFRTRKPLQATEYLHHVRLGQTERGSYILNLRSAVPPRFREAANSSEIIGLPKLLSSVIERDEPFERRVTLMLARSLGVIRSALASVAVTGDIAPFQAAAAEGVSANLCAALAGLNVGSNAQTVEISLRWSPMRPLPPGTEQGRFRLSADALITLAEVARELKERTAYEDFELNGVVTALHREQGEGKGRITVTGLVDGSLRKILLELEPTDYKHALYAHSQQLSVACEGELEREGRSYRLLNPRKFVVIAEP